MEIKGYITNLGKYNEGELVGQWVEFPISDEGIQLALRDIGCCHYKENGEYVNTGYEEFFFTDWDCEVNLGFGEYEDIDRVNEIAEAIERMKDWEENTFKAALELTDSAEEALELDNFCMIEGVKDEYELGEYYAEETFDSSMKSSTLYRYFDFEAFGRDVRIEEGGLFTEWGYIFSY